MSPLDDLVDEPLTIQAAHLNYDIAERELWEEYADDPTYVAGRIYIAGENYLRKKCQRAVERLRYQRFDDVRMP